MTRKSPHRERLLKVEQLAQNEAEGADHYKVGPGRPPREHQWKPGQSGNPKGRKRNSPSADPALKAALQRALNSRVTLKQGDREQVVSCAEAGIRQLVAQFARGDRHARRDLFTCAERLGVTLDGGLAEALSDAMAATAQRALDDYLARQTGRRDQSTASPIIAPPELLDDDSDQEPDR